MNSAPLPDHLPITCPNVLSANTFDAGPVWARSWGDLGLSRPAEGVFCQVMAAYQSEGRAYHTLQHLGECFERFEEVRDAADRAGEVEVALWFHDAVYDTHRADNEAASAAWAQAVVAGVGGTQHVLDRIGRLILATRHDSAPTDPDQALMVDIDLAILGADQPRFDEYESQIRREYQWVPEQLFRDRRRAILQGFLDRPRIYGTDHFRTRLETTARANLERALARLTSS